MTVSLNSKALILGISRQYLYAMIIPGHLFMGAHVKVFSYAIFVCPTGPVLLSTQITLPWRLSGPAHRPAPAVQVSCSPLKDLSPALDTSETGRQRLIVQLSCLSPFTTV